MSLVYLILPVAMTLVALFVAAFLWSVKSGQMDDLDTPAARMLHDDEPSGYGVRGNPGSRAP